MKYGIPIARLTSIAPSPRPHAPSYRSRWVPSNDARSRSESLLRHSVSQAQDQMDPVHDDTFRDGSDTRAVPRAGRLFARVLVVTFTPLQLPLEAALAGLTMIAAFASCPRRSRGLAICESTGAGSWSSPVLRTSDIPGHDRHPYTGRVLVRRNAKHRREGAGGSSSSFDRAVPQSYVEQRECNTWAVQAGDPGRSPSS